ncbi:Zn-dependent oligopeptidase [Candidatus Poribacteria bacterium]|nr:Zn-dependent oligopeptidase [Candidatus Poribacteria bacterium]MYB02168.1 Zn-dependent oligopeptidase [Candidatus Poribacteria bacterium]
MRTPNVSEAKEKIQVIKYLDVGEMTITGSGKVNNKAFYAAKEIVLTITAKRPEILSKLSGYEFILIAPGESITASLGWEESKSRLAGLALTPQESLGFPGRFASYIEKKKKPSMDTFVHEFGHAVHSVVSKMDPEFNPLLNRAYKQAMALGLWRDKYFSVDNWKLESSPVDEYWAEGVRMWYYVGKNQEFKTRDAFKKYDPGITDLIGLWLSAEEIPRGY